MTNTRRGTGLFNHLLGFPDPKSEPPPVALLSQHEAHKLGLVKGREIWIDNKIVTVMFWPRPDSPLHDSKMNHIFKTSGAKFFDFDLSVSDRSKVYGIKESMIWVPGSKGRMETQMVDIALTQAGFFRDNTELEFIKKYKEYTGLASEYGELRWAMAGRCDKLFSQRLGMLVNEQEFIHKEINAMRDNEGPQVY